jgi:hypothetical protein
VREAARAELRPHRVRLQNLSSFLHISYNRAFAVKVATKRLPVFPFSGLLKGSKGHKTHRFENGGTNQMLVDSGLVGRKDRPRVKYQLVYLSIRRQTFFTSVIIQDKLTDVGGGSLWPNDFESTLCDIRTQHAAGWSRGTTSGARGAEGDWKKRLTRRTERHMRGFLSARYPCNGEARNLADEPRE